MLIDEPGVEVEVTAAAAALVVPTKLVVSAERHCAVTSGPPGADLAGPLLDPLPGADGWRGAEELGSFSAQVAVFAPEHLVRRAQVTMSHSGPLAVGAEAIPPVDSMVRRDLDDIGSEQRVERRGTDQRGENFQPVPASAGVLLWQQGCRHGHFGSPQTVRRAASKVGSWTSTCP